MIERTWGVGMLRASAVAAAIVVMIGWAGATVTGQKGKPDPRRTPAQTVWPLPPDQPRVRLVGVYAGAVDVGAARPPRRVSLTETLLGRGAAADAKPKPGTLSKPFGVAIDKYGRFLVADAGVPGVAVLDPERHAFTMIGEIEGQQYFRSPIGLAVDDAGNSYVGDNGLRQVLVFGPDLALRRKIGTGEIDSASGLAIDEARKRLYVVDSRRHQVAVFDLPSGKLAARIGKRGTGPAEFNYPTGVAVGPDGQVYVTDTMNYRVEVFTPDLVLARAFGSLGTSPGEFRRPKGIAVDAENVIYVVDSDFSNFQMFSADGHPLMWVGEFGDRPGQMLLPAGIAVDRLRRRILVSEQVGRRVQMFERIVQR